MRKLKEIAKEIDDNWERPYFGAVPYINAMHMVSDIADEYGQDNGEYIVRYFLGNAQTWRGDVARRIKAELNGMLK